MFMQVNSAQHCALLIPLNFVAEGEKLPLKPRAIDFLLAHE